MGVLTEYVKREKDKLYAEKSKREEIEREWLIAIDDLYKNMKKWIEEADQDSGLLQFKETQSVIRLEPQIGVYEVRCCQVSLGSRRVEIVPKARFTTSQVVTPNGQTEETTGIVELKDGNIPEYFLFRTQHNQWYLQSIQQWNSDRNQSRVITLNRESFEEAVLKILK